MYLEQLPGLDTRDTTTPRHGLTSADTYLLFQMQLGFSLPLGMGFEDSNHAHRLPLGPLAPSIALIKLPTAALK